MADPNFASLLLELSEQIEKSELETMKYFCGEVYGIGLQRLEAIKKGIDLFQELKKRDLLGPQKKDILVKLLEKADRIDLKNKVLGIGAPTVVSQPAGLRAPVVNNVLKDTHLNDIAEDLGRDWKPLGRNLGISSNILGNIDEENRRVKEKSFQTLLRWKKRSGNDATVHVLAEALIGIGRRDIAELLTRVCQQDVLICEERPENSPVSEESQIDSGGLNTMQADMAPRLPTQESHTE